MLHETFCFAYDGNEFGFALRVPNQDDALAVARTESGVCHWTPDGSVVTSSAGAIGVMQLEPATAAQLGVDPYNVNANIHGGVAYLKELYQKYGNWSAPWLLTTGDRERWTTR